MDQRSDGASDVILSEAGAFITIIAMARASNGDVPPGKDPDDFLDQLYAPFKGSEELLFVAGLRVIDGLLKDLDEGGGPISGRAALVGLMHQHTRTGAE